MIRATLLREHLTSCRRSHLCTGPAEPRLGRPERAGHVGDLLSGARLVLGVQTTGGLKVVGTTHPIGASDAAMLGPLLPLAEPGDRRMWAPFKEHRHDSWVRLPAHLTAEVVVSHPDGSLLRQPARFLRWRVE